MTNKTIVVTVALLIGLCGCASEYKTEGKEEAAAKKMETGPVNCKTAEGDLRMLNSEKVNAAQQAAAGVSTITPIGLVGGLVTGTEGEKAQITTGEYNKVLDAAIAHIKSSCNIK
jgi:hypothetical protein